jgi:hypothetical protein
MPSEVVHQHWIFTNEIFLRICLLAGMDDVRYNILEYVTLRDFLIFYVGNAINLSTAESERLRSDFKDTNLS